MPSTYQLSELRDWIRTEGDVRAPRVLDPALDRAINSAVRRSRIILASKHPQRFLSTDTVSVVAGTRSYSLPSDYYTGLTIYVDDTNSRDDRKALDRIEWSERLIYTASLKTSNSKKRDAKYALQGSQIHIWPKPSWSGDVYLEYVGEEAALTNPTDTYSEPVPGAVEWIVYDTLMRLYAMNRLPLSHWAELRGDQERTIGIAAQLDTHRRRKVVDVSPDPRKFF